MAFQQKYKYSDDEEFPEDVSDYDSDNELTDTKLLKRSDSTVSSPPKERRSWKESRFIFPSQQTRSGYRMRQY